MKAAVCLMGLSLGYNDKGDIVGFEKASNSIKKHIIAPNNADVFFHTWSINEKAQEQLVDIYNPKLYVLESKKMFDATTSKIHQIRSRWYSHKESLNLAFNYQTKNNIQYDYIFVTRFDCEYYSDFNFLNLDTNAFYTSNWHLPYRDQGFLDYWFVAGSDIMKCYSTVYDSLTTDYINENESSNHVIAKRFADDLKLNVKYIKTEHTDFKLALRNY